MSSLANRVATHTGRDAVLAPASIDDAVRLATTDLIVLVTSPAPPLVAALGEAIRGGPATVLVGSDPELAACLEDTRWAQARGRSFLAREWLANADATLYGRRGAALASPFVTERPRTLAESPAPTPDAVRHALLKAAATLDPRRYPPLRPTRLAAALARREGVPANEIIVSGGGSLELLGRVLRACADPRDEVIARAPTYDALAAICLREGLACRFVPDLAAAAPRARLVYLATPNVPDSRITDPAEIKAIRSALPPDRVLLLDEAYAGFAPPPEFPPATPGPIVRLRSMSKIDGLAALRIGYAIAPPPIAALLESFADPFALTTFAEEAALAAIAHGSTAGEAVREIARLRDELVLVLRAHAFDVPDSPTHLLLARPPEGRFDDALAICEQHDLPIEECTSRAGWLQLSVVDDATRARIAKAFRKAGFA